MVRALVGSLMPRTRDRTVEFDLPPIETAADARAASAAVLASCSRGELTPNEAAAVMALISSLVRTIEVTEFETRVTALEDREESEESLDAPNLDSIPESMRQRALDAFKNRQRLRGRR